MSVFIAVEKQGWVRRTVPLVCKYWHELYRSQDASPLHETLELNFRKEVERASAREWGQEEDDEDWALRHPGYASRLISWAADYPIHGSRVISWAERRAGSVRKLHFEGGFRGAFEDFSPWDLGRLVTLTGPSLVELRIGRWGFEELRKKRFWKSLRDPVVPARQLRFLVVNDDDGVSESDVEPLGQLAGSLEELVLKTAFSNYHVVAHFSHFFSPPALSFQLRARPSAFPSLFRAANGLSPPSLASAARRATS